ncbi:MAG TPA: prolyl oligopeptidase family serine peptidase [Vicinamibacterales bacterium]|nr:prolyl oligopeptidase family serine peptidase [Vicinamibacterales bacterium]
MRNARLLSASILAGALASATAFTQAPSHLAYPPARRGNVVDNYAGTKVAAPYRWMEDLDSREVADWVAAENRLTFGYLSRLPLRDVLKKRITELSDYKKTGIPDIEAGRLFYRMNRGLQKQSPVYVRARLESAPTLVIDPNVISPNGDIALASTAASPDAKLLAYTLSEGGSDWRTIHVREVGSGRDLPDVVKWMKFSGLSWTNDSRGFFYSRYPEPPKGKALEAALSGQALYYHRIGTPQTQDRLIYARKDLPTWFIGGSVTEDGRYLLVTLSRGSENRNRLYVADLIDPRHPRIDASVEPLIEADNAEYAPLGNQGSTIFLRTDLNAPNRKVIAIDMNHPQAAAWKTIVPEAKNALESAGIFGGHIVADYLVDVQSRVRVFGLDGTPQGEIALPSAGALAGLGGRQDSPLMFYGFTSPLYPSTVFAYDLTTRKSTPFEAPKPPVDVSRYETKQLFATSKDGTRVPFFITARRDLKRDGSNPTMVYGYGGFSIVTMPTYRADVPAWLERGGVWVTANMRGGAEYGEAWHRAGMLEKKQNVFDDFVAVAEYLVKEKYTSPAKLGIMGGSNGGLLIGAVEEQRPDLYAVALPAVGVMDMLRYDKFTGGRAWVPEYGSSSNPEQFKFLIAYSPVQNVKRGVCYPATLATTADHDDRVVPSHSFKFIAAMQAAQGCDKPVLIRVETEGSHGYRPLDKRIAEQADEWAFAAAQMHLTAGAAASR